MGLHGVSGEDGIYYSHQTGRKKYEIKNHLGNVHLVVSDKKVGQDSLVGQSGDGIIDHYTTINTDYYDYYPFGWFIQDRNYNLNGVDLGAYRYGFNGQEKVDEVSGSGNSYTTHFRHYDSRLGRWLSTDPRMDKYSGFSPYCAMGNNPILIIDQAGDTLRVHGGSAEFTKFKAMLDKTFAGTVIVQVAKNVTVTLHGDKSKLSKNDQQLYDNLNTVISSTKTTDVRLLSKSEGKYAIGGAWHGATVDGKKVNTIDLYDLEKFDGQSLSPEGFIIHEIWETYQDQVKGKTNYNDAHQEATKEQGEVDGVTLNSQWGNFDSAGTGKGYSNYTTSSGKKMTMVAKVTKMEVVGVTKVEGHVVSDGKGGTKIIK